MSSLGKPVASPITLREIFSRAARGIACAAGHPLAFIFAVASVVIWAALGPRLHYSETWQLWINTSTTILTFLMVFLLQHTQNRESRATQIKLDELLRAVKGARNELINLENLSEAELEKYCQEFGELHLRHAKIIEKHGARLEVTAEAASVSRVPGKLKKRS